MKTIKLAKNLTHLIFTLGYILLFQNIAYAEEIKKDKKEIKNDGIFSIGMPLEIKYGIKDNFSVALSGFVGYAKAKAKYSLIQENMTSISSNITLNLLYYFDRTKIRPFIGISSGLKTDNLKSESTTITDNILNISFLSGIEYFLSDNIALSFDIDINETKNLTPTIGVNARYDEMFIFSFSSNFKAYYYFF